MGMQTVARVEESFEGMFECRHCELEVPATVYARSSGSARGLGAAAEAAAIEDAEMDASALASRTLQFVRCPRCRKKDPGGRGYRVQVTVGVLVLGAICGGLMYLLVGMRSRGEADAGTAQWASIGFGVVMALLLYWKWGRPWRSADKRTVFHRTAP
ncbi:MAG TPA: hypothetical protein VK932_20830 [Kofleriaceae bacterium]|nr:hypothetical protein [Kofleriaceae bacterium]